MAKQQQEYDSTVSDMFLINAFSNGDEKSFEVLYSRYRKSLYGYLNNLCNNNSFEADDIFEETWLKVIEKLPKYSDIGKFSAWLFRIARNIFIDRIRHNKPDKVVQINEENEFLLPADTGLTPERRLGASDIGSVLQKALSTLQPEQKEVFLLREEEDLTFKEIAEIQNCSLGTVLSRMRYALKNLRNFLQEIDRGGFVK